MWWPQYGESSPRERYGAIKMKNDMRRYVGGAVLRELPGRDMEQGKQGWGGNDWRIHTKGQSESAIGESELGKVRWDE